MGWTIHFALTTIVFPDNCKQMRRTSLPLGTRKKWQLLTAKVSSMADYYEGVDQGQRQRRRSQRETTPGSCTPCSQFQLACNKYCLIPSPSLISTKRGVGNLTGYLPYSRQSQECEHQKKVGWETCLRPAKVHFPEPSWPKPKMEMMEEASEGGSGSSPTGLGLLPGTPRPRM